VLVEGWAIDAGALAGSGVDAVHVWAYPITGAGFGAPVFVGAATLGLSRPDVAAVFGAQFGNAGFALQGAPLPPGTYRLVAYAHSAVAAAVTQTRFADITISSGAVTNPWMEIEGLPSGSTRARPFLVSGWAVDFGASPGTGVDAVHVWAFPVGGGSATFVGAASYGAARPDIAAIFGPTFANSGFSLTVSALAPGTYDLAAYMRSTVTGTATLSRIVRVTVQ